MQKLVYFLLFAASFAPAQTPTVAPAWFKVGAGGDTITAAKGTIFRYGMAASKYAFDCDDAALCGTHKAGDPSTEAWSPVRTAPADETFVAGDDFFGGDPSYDVYKEVDVQETAVAQTVTVTPADGSPARKVTVPALPSITISTGPWTGPMLTCWQQAAKATNPDGSSGATYIVVICNVPK